MKVNEKTVVGVDWPLCVPLNRGERSTRMVRTVRLRVYVSFVSQLYVCVHVYVGSIYSYFGFFVLV